MGRESLTSRIFPGTSEMARRMRAFDWSKTPLGPVEKWPQALRTSVSTCLDCAFPIVLWWGPELAILYNDEYGQIMGPKHPAALGRPGAEVWAEIWDIIAPMLSHVMESAQPTRSRDLLLHVDRGFPEEAYFSFSYSPIHTDDGKVGGIFCPVIETTEKVIGERRLRTLRDLAAQCKGAESEDFAYQAAAEIFTANLQDVPFALIYRIDESGARAILTAAAGIARGTVASPERVELEAEAIWSLRSVACSGEAAIVTGLGERFAELPTGAWKIAPHTAMSLPVLLPGQEHPHAILVAAASPMRALDEDYRTFFGLAATQLASALADAQALEAERRRAESLAELDRAKTIFFSNVSHEFRTPLTLMIGPLEDLIADGANLPAEAAAALDLAHRNGLRLLRLVNTLLDFSRIEAGRIDASYQPTDLAAFTADLASVFRSAIEKAGLRLVVECPPLGEPVYVDRDMWEKIVLNLLSNAFKFTFEGEIGVSLRGRGEHVELRVRDTGVGIAAEEMPQMFQRFHRVKQPRSRTHEGTGIGLALVSELVRLHAGTIAVDSRPGEGSSFVVSIPTGKEHLPADRIGAARQLATTSVGAIPFVEEALRWLPDGTAPASRAEIPGSGAGRAAENARILIADDNADVRAYLGRILEPSYRVEAAADGNAALASILADPPELVLSDVMMPGLDGFGLLAAIRADPRTASLPVILLSARAGEEARIEGLRAGADEYLVKPFSARELAATVASQLALARLRREGEQALVAAHDRVTESETQLREADRRKDEFLAVLAHELRNPLAPIRTGLELMRLSGDKAETVSRVRGVMERQIITMVRLIDDLLDVSRITSGKIVLQRRPTQLAELIENALDSQRSALEAAGVNVSVEYPETPSLVDADPTRLTQVLSNVLHNAAKYTPAGGQVRLTAQLFPAQVADDGREDVVITVSDTGIGISEALLPQIFELFAQGEPSTHRAHSGLGVGLALARRLVDLHGGSIEAHSAGPGRGSSFVIRLPASATRSAEPERSSPADRPVASRVVIIDDNRDAATMLSLLIERLGGSARTAHDAEAGLAAIAEFHPEIVFLDIGMPGTDGYEVVRRIRATPNLNGLMVVAVTGWGQPQDKQRALESGFDAHLTKPVDPAALAQLFAGREAR